MKRLISAILMMAATAAAAPSPYPITVNSKADTAPALQLYRANARTIRVSFVDGATPSVVTSYTPFMTWATSNTASAIATASWAFVNSTTGQVDFTWTQASLNYTPGRYVYEVGLKSGSVPTTYRQGVLTIVGSPTGVGATPVTWTSNINWTLYRYTLTSTKGPVRPDGTSITATTNSDGSIRIAATAAAATNSTRLNGQLASYYRNAANITNEGMFTGLPADNLTGTVANARLDADLQALAVNNGASLTNLSASALASGTVPNARLDADLQALAVNNGGALTNVNAATLNSQPSSYYRNAVNLTNSVLADWDGTWLTYSPSYFKNAANVTNEAAFTGLPASQLTGTVATAAQQTIDHGNLLGLGDNDHPRYHDAAQLTGTVANARLDSDLQALANNNGGALTNVNASALNSQAGSYYRNAANITNEAYFAGLPASQLTGTVANTLLDVDLQKLAKNDGGSLTNLVEADTLQTVANRGSTSTQLLSSSHNYTNTAPANTEYAQAGWVRSLALQGQEWFFNNVATNPAGGKTTNTVRLARNPVATAFTNTIASPVPANSYLIGGITTQLFSQLRSPVSFEVFAARVGGNATTVIPAHMEVYYRYSGTTNLYGDWDTANQNIGASASATRYTFIVPFTEPTITGAVEILAYLKSGTPSGTASGLRVFGGGTTDSHMDLEAAIEGESAAEVAADLAAHKIDASAHTALVKTDGSRAMGNLTVQTNVAFSGAGDHWVYSPSNSLLQLMGGVSDNNSPLVKLDQNAAYPVSIESGNGNGTEKPMKLFASRFLIQDQSTDSAYSNGNWGFGTANPTAKIDVNGTGRFGDVVTLLKSGTTSNSAIRRVDTFAGSGSTGLVYSTTAANNTKYLRGDGTWQTVSGGSGSQTPWTNNISAAGYSLTGVNGVTTTNANAVVVDLGDYVQWKGAGFTNDMTCVSNRFRIYHRKAGAVVTNIWILD